MTNDEMLFSSGEEETEVNRKKAVTFSAQEFAKIIIADLAQNGNGKRFLKSYKQSEVRDIIENFQRGNNQDKLVQISQLLYAKSPQYKSVVDYFANLPTFPHVLKPIKDIQAMDQDKVITEYTKMGEELKKMNLRHEMQKVLTTAFIEDTFFGYVWRTNDDFYIQQIDYSICEITSVEYGVYNFSIDMSYFMKDESLLDDGWAQEIKDKYHAWYKLYSKNSKIGTYVELDAKNTICIKINENMLDTFPPFAGSFDAIFDIEGFKQLRKDREEIGNYMLVTQQLPIREDSEHDNDFAIDNDYFTYFHNMLAGAVPDSVGVVTSPMKMNAVTFDKDRVDSDGVAKAERDFWSGNGTSQLLFSSDTSTSQGLLMSIKVDEQKIFRVVSQIERWLNRYLGFYFPKRIYSAEILKVTDFNKQEMYKMYLEAGQYGIPTKNHIAATVGFSPIETMNMAYLENDLLNMHEEFMPLQSSHTMSGDEEASLDKAGSEGRPKADDADLSDEGAKSREKDSSTKA